MLKLIGLEPGFAPHMPPAWILDTCRTAHTCQHNTHTHTHTQVHTTPCQWLLQEEHTLHAARPRSTLASSPGPPVDVVLQEVCRWVERKVCSTVLWAVYHYFLPMRFTMHWKGLHGDETSSTNTLIHTDIHNNNNCTLSKDGSLRMQATPNLKWHSSVGYIKSQCKRYLLIGTSCKKWGINAPPKCRCIR